MGRRLLIAVLVAAVALLCWRSQSEDALAPPAEVERRAALESIREARTSVPLEPRRPRSEAQPERPSEPGRESVAAQPAVAAGIVLEGRVLGLAAGADPRFARPQTGVDVARALGLAGRGKKAPATRSGPDGSFRLVLPDSGERPFEIRLVVAGDERFRGSEVVVRLAEGETRQAGLEILRREHGALTGRTLDLAGNGIPGVEIVLQEWDQAGGAQVARESTLSGAGGAFRFERARPFTALAVQAPGRVLLEARMPKANEDGTWQPFDLWLGGAAALRVRVRDPLGAPLAGLWVSARIAETERLHAQGLSDSLRLPCRAVCDDTGEAHLADVWAGQQLTVVVSRAPAENWVELLAFERIDGLLPVPRGEERGTPLVLVPGEERELRVEFATRFRISGRVLETGAGPFSEPWVTVHTLDVPRHAPGWFEQSMWGDGYGRFTLDLACAWPLGRVRVMARAFPEGRRSLTQTADPTRAAQADLDLRGRASGTEQLTLVLEPTLAITGRVEAPSGEDAVQASVRVHAAVAEAFPGFPPRAASVPEYTRKGAFHLPGLAPGRYDLEVQPSSRFPRTWVRGVEAGTEDLVILLEGTRPVRVTVEVGSAAGELEETILLCGSFRPSGEPPSVPELAPSVTLSALEGWPAGMLTLWSGGGGRSALNGQSSHTLTPMKTNPTTLELDEGLWWIGAKARLKDGTYAFPIGTGLVQLAPGEYRLRFELTRCGTLEGRVQGALTGRGLAAALAHAGALLVLDVGKREMFPLCELGTDGSFRFPLVPAVPLELRVGTREELLGGRWTERRSLRPEAGETLRVLVGL